MSDNIEIKDIELEKKQKALEEAYDKHNKFIDEHSTYELYYTNKEEFEELKKEAKKCERVLAFHHLWKEEFKPIKSIIDSYRKEIDFVDRNDLFKYDIKKNGDIHFLSFSFSHYDYDKIKSRRIACDYLDEPPRNDLFGYIVYDSKGHIYLSNKNRQDIYGVSPEAGIKNNGIYFCNCNFLDDEYMYLQENHLANLYKLINDKYELVYSFEKDEHIDFQPTLWEKKLLLVNKIMDNKSKIFSVDEKKYIFETKKGSLKTCDSTYLGDIIDEDKENEELYNQSQTLMSNYLKENNLLILEDSIYVEYYKKEFRRVYTKSYKTMCFADMKGHIVSKLYVKSMDDGKYDEFDINEDTYEEDLNKIKEYYSKELKKKIIRMDAAKKAAETRKKRKKLQNYKMFYETLNDYCQSSESKKKTYCPNENNQKEQKQD